MLEGFGIDEIHTGSTAEEGLRLCQAHYYDAILSDFNLGSGKTGLQMLEHLRHHNLIKRKQVFILISAENSKDTVLAATDVEPDAYLSKPVTGQELKRRLNRLFAERKNLNNLYRALDAGDTDTVVAECRLNIKNNTPYTSACQKLLGKVLLEAGDTSGAEAIYRSVLEVRPLEWAKIGMAMVRQRSGDLTTAESWFREIIESNPLSLKAYDGLAEVYANLEDDENLQKTLQDAATVSPLALQRQQRLGDVAAHNKDHLTAAKAYRRVVKLADQSVYKSAEQNLAFAQSTARLAEQDDNAAADLSKDALRAIRSVEAAGTNPELKLKADMLEVQLLIQARESQKAKQQFEAIKGQVDAAVGQLEFSAHVEWARTLLSLDETAEAEFEIEQLISLYEGDEEKMEVIDTLLPEPKSKANRRFVAKINKEGIKHYEAKNYRESFDAFVYAKRFFPKNIGIHLNLVQVAVEEIEHYGCSGDVLDEAMDSLSKVNNYIANTDVQYPRFLKLREMIGNIATG
jgi:DNA-binding response OmpR family regulator